ncbi:MAG: response regulator [Candidatus Nitrosopolaris sp.]
MSSTLSWYWIWKATCFERPVYLFIQLFSVCDHHRPFCNVDAKTRSRKTKAATKEEEYKKQYHVRTRILIIDDEPDITLTFRKALTDKGFDQVETANDPILDVKNFRAGSYDLLIIDIVMSQLDGFSLYENIRKIDNKVKVCFITAFEINYQALRAVFPAVTTTTSI